MRTRNILTASCFAFALYGASVNAQSPTFRRGDANGDGTYNIADPVFLLNYLALGGFAPNCLDAADTNDDGTVSIADVIYTLSFLFMGALPPPQPFPLCGDDVTSDVIDCAAYICRWSLPPECGILAEPRAGGQRRNASTSPPSTLSTCPVVRRERALVRNMMASAWSSAVISARSSVRSA